MIQSEIIIEDSEVKMVENLNYFLEKLLDHQLLDVKFSTIKLQNIKFVCLILYKME